ncbi:alpha/beta hydrolase [Idiomarina sp. HP20-50]|uniref:alpha/beta fold hydrolase n=1 Tax=Idiomarina sp. HP20-50 TaxID=3070813 RepID=UPI00294B304C|nr:alpha/beta hydrolase [Idiomarina sp. HP20-50]MDV6316998.1 alpha/beta hydrolase [Idiomarina sp. HP20-50]
MNKQQIAIRNNVRIRGEGTKTLVFAHGFGCDQTIWDAVIEQLPQSYRIVTFDYVGSGNSDVASYSEKRYENLEGYARDLIEVVETLEADSITLIGHSVSGSIACLAYPFIKYKVNHIVMLNPSPRYIHDPPQYQSGFSKPDVDELMILMEQNFFGWAQYMSPQVMENSDQPKLAKTLEDYFTAGNAQLTRNFAKATFYSDVRESLPHVDCAVTILQANADIVVPLDVSRYMAKQLPKARLHVLDARGHYPQLSAPNLVAEHLIESLKDKTA